MIEQTHMKGMALWLGMGALFVGSVEAALGQAPFGGGSGTAADPYRIEAIAHLNAIRGEYLDDIFTLENNLDFLDVDGVGGDYVYDDPGKGWLPLAHDRDNTNDTDIANYDGPPFTGTLEGQGFVIRNLRITRPDALYLGLFGVLGAGAVVDSLGLEDVDIRSVPHQVGALAGENRGTISYSYSTGTLFGLGNIGGLVGFNAATGVIESCYSEVNMTSASPEGGVGGLAGFSAGVVRKSYATGSVFGVKFIGGLVGYNFEGSSIHMSYAAGRVSGVGNQIGGLLGRNDGGTVENSYATGRVSGKDIVGGFVGSNRSGSATTSASIVRKSHSTGVVSGGLFVGGFVGNDRGMITDGFWNTQTSGTNRGAGFATGMPTEVFSTTTEGMYSLGISVFGLDLAAIWHPPSPRAASNKFFPRLRGVVRNAQVLDMPEIRPMQFGDPAFPLAHTFLSPEMIAGADIRFESSNTAVATVADDGRVSILAPGSTRLTITRTGGTADAYATVRASRVLKVLYATGAGTAAEPYEIHTLADLNAIRGEYLDDTFLLMRDLDFNDANGDGMTDDPFVYHPGDATENAKGWLPIGHGSFTRVDRTPVAFQGSSFRGSFRGNNKVIRNLLVAREEDSFVGLFGFVGSDGVIDSLSLEAVNITGLHAVGGLAGGSEGSIRHVRVAGSVSGIGRPVGGLAGLMEGASAIRNSAFVGKVSGLSITGGLVGWVLSRGLIMHSYSAGTVSTETSQVGGLVGIGVAASTVESCYSTSAVLGLGAAGGLVGTSLGTIRNSYSTGAVRALTSLSNNTIGGFVGDHQGTVEHSYWNTETSGQTAGARDLAGTDITSTLPGLTGLSTSAMYLQGSFEASWFGTSTAWLPPVHDAALPAGNAFPRLRDVGKNVQVLHFPPLTPQDVPAPAPAFALAHDFLSPVEIAGSSTRFSSSNEAVATVDDNGMVRILKSGRTTFTITRTGNDDYLRVQASQVLSMSPFAGGSGTAADPFQITTIEELHAIRGAYLNDTFLLMRDLDFFDVDGRGTDYVYAVPAKGWLPIGHDTQVGTDDFQGDAFRGVFRGGGYVIQNLFIARATEEYVGLFGLVNGGRIDSLGLEELNVKGKGHVGGVAGGNSGMISRSYATGMVSGETHVGGLAGDNTSIGPETGLISRSYAAARVSGTNRVGGIVGENLGLSLYRAEATIRDCYATGTVSGQERVGGIVGYNLFLLKNCYSASVVSGVSRVGVLVGLNSSTVENSYWTGASASGIGEGDMSGAVERSTAEMYDRANFSGFAFGQNDAWLPPLGTGNKVFPLLRELAKNAQALHYPSIAAKAPGAPAFRLPYELLSPVMLSGSTTRFSSSNEAVATVDNMGLVTIVGAGETVLSIIRAGNDEYVTLWNVRTLRVGNSPLTGLEEEEEETLLVRLFPNPVDGFLTIGGLAAYDELEIYDLAGRLVHHETEGLQIDLRALPRGMYLVKIRASAATYSRRVWKR